MRSELAFRAQLGSPGQRDLYDYRRDRVRAGRLPARKDIDPAAIRTLLSDISLIDLDHGLEDAVFRLAGTGIREIYGFEVTGVALNDPDWGDREDYWRSVYRRIVESQVPMQGHVTGPMSGREHVAVAWLRLPLSEDGERVNKILCHDVRTPEQENAAGDAAAGMIARVA